jgi:hypothetical protein
MKVFLSWSGERSKIVGNALKHWLSYVFPGLDVWMSDQDIQAGARWGIELGSILKECKLGILCLTPESLDSHWLAFEAGALSNAIDNSRVIPYRFHLSSTDIGPPLSQFQDVAADKAGTFKLVISINDLLDKQFGDEERLKVIYEHWWPDLEQQLAAIKSAEHVQHRSEREILEEILELVRQSGFRDLTNFLGHLFSLNTVKRVEVAPKMVGGTTTNRLALRITVSKKLPLIDIPPDQLIPSSIFGMPTDVIEESLQLS